MKKMFLYSFIVFLGVVISLTLFGFSLAFPWGYNDIDGFTGFLLGTETVYLFFLSLAIIFIGLKLMITESKK